MLTFVLYLALAIVLVSLAALIVVGVVLMRQDRRDQRARLALVSRPSVTEDGAHGA